jgi:hypothetical protein
VAEGLGFLAKAKFEEYDLSIYELPDNFNRTFLAETALSLR